MSHPPLEETAPTGTSPSLPESSTADPAVRREIATQLRLEGLNNAQIARLLGVNRSTVGRWELTEQEHIL
ncbi:helix-turn-helix domain-containing protein [Leucobacter coleopterorum]|uniref:Helix-turn-helix domain-containing protein n=1 Tax=Leucobacter coleopterorum TaxID=2714933 RepID=A0ABX6JZJ8_9MICO|nr:helix-turn-helix domain-containing protein [Leucobacter coleopterorum]